MRQEEFKTKEHGFLLTQIFKMRAIKFCICTILLSSYYILGIFMYYAMMTIGPLNEVVCVFIILLLTIGK